IECHQLADSKDQQSAADRMVGKIESLYHESAQAAMGEKVVDHRRKPWWHGDVKLTKLFRQFNRLKKRDYRHHTPESRAAADQAYREYREHAAKVKQAHWEKQCSRIADGNHINWAAFKRCHKAETLPVNCVRDKAGNLPETSKQALDSLGKHFANVCTVPELKSPTAVQEECRRNVEPTNQNAFSSKSDALDKAFTLDEAASN